MDANAQLTDQQRVELAGLEYQPLGVGDHVRLSNGKRIGRVKRAFYKQNGLRGTIIVNHHQDHNEITVLFRGSSGLRHGNPTTWSNEWLATNLPIGRLIVEHRVGEIPSQLKSAAGLLNHLMQQDLTAHYYILWSFARCNQCPVCPCQLHLPSQSKRSLALRGAKRLLAA